ncbi:hypothetical protein BDY24DRAFT_167250 [Mrakia frigida]|uniref:uncharacterized protein n=1 Tax=Mrakia frigida TaxID=29902 RepID=UPI003FCC1F34
MLPRSLDPKDPSFEDPLKEKSFHLPSSSTTSRRGEPTFQQQLSPSPTVSPTRIPPRPRILVSKGGAATTATRTGRIPTRFGEQKEPSTTRRSQLGTRPPPFETQTFPSRWTASAPRISILKPSLPSTPGRTTHRPSSLPLNLTPPDSTSLPSLAT